jgi:hypothetical protein
MKRLLVSILAPFFFAAFAAVVTPSSQANFSVKSATFNKFDNSARNKFNPDPGKEAPYGEPTYDEMMMGFLDYSVGQKRASRQCRRRKTLRRNMEGQTASRCDY